MTTSLPIEQVLERLQSALNDHRGAVLIAPPGAGKTTAVAPALLDAKWCEGQIILTSPRRVAARAAAERMAQMLGEEPGETVGYLTRLDSKMSAKTRIVIMTEAIFVNRIVDDPELPGVSAVLFDEAHERHLDSDLGLALALETREILRDDLRVLVMSATIDGSRFADLMGGDVPIIESEGRAYPLEIRWLGVSPDARIEDAMAGAISQAWRGEQGDILAFLPGVGEIERTRERLENALPDALVLPLHGQVQPADQRAAISRDREGRRRIVLATAIAETSLTLDGVSVVVDSGLARHAHFDRAAGTTHLVTHRASQAASAQRAGRAARQGPGIAYRLWNEAAHSGLPVFDLPEIATADLAPLVLKLARWGAQDPASLQWLDAPNQAAVSAARNTLIKLGALDQEHRITAFGGKVASLPMDPVSAATILYGAEHGQAVAAAQLVALQQERGLGGRGEDLLQRMSRWAGERGQRAQAARKLAERWAKTAERLVDVQVAEPANPAIFLAQARPDFVAKRRDNSGEHWLIAGGRGFMLDPASPLARAEWLIIADAQGQAKGARITSAAEMSQAEVEQELENLIQKECIISWNKAEKRAEARIERRLGAITMSSGPDPSPDPDRIVDMLVDKAVEGLGELLPEALLARARYAEIDGLKPETLRDQASIWLVPLLAGRRDLGLAKGKLADAVLNQLSWDDRQKLDAMAPREFVSPAGTHHAVDYAGDDAPSIEVRVQALFGLDQHPQIGRTPLLLKLTSPAGRPIQSTRDLPRFWRGSWNDVRKDMKGRYPKHRWPEQPWTEKPSLKTKNAFNRS